MGTCRAGKCGLYNLMYYITIGTISHQATFPSSERHIFEDYICWLSVRVPRAYGDQVHTGGIDYWWTILKAALPAKLASNPVWRKCKPDAVAVCRGVPVEVGGAERPLREDWPQSG